VRGGDRPLPADEGRGGNAVTSADLLVIAEVASLLRISKSLSYRLCTDGTIPSARVAGVASRRGRLVVRRQDVDAYIDRLFAGTDKTATMVALREASRRYALGK